MFKNILFATTASPSCDHAARVAFDIAKRYDARLTVFHVLGIPSRGFSQTVTDFRTGEKVTYDDDYLNWVKDEMKNTYSRQIEFYARCELEALPGIPYTEILRAARKNNVDLIVMGSKRKEGEEEQSLASSLFAGNTLQAVTKSARCPVLIVGRPAASFWGGFSNIVFGTDFSKSSEAAFLFAIKLAKSLSCTLHIFHAYDISMLHSGKMMNQDEIEDDMRDAREKMRRLYGARIKEIHDHEIEVWEGIPYVEIVKYAREKYADLIVMAHHTREPSPEKIKLGSTVEQVSLRATCPVVSVNRPDKVRDM
jgi:nucleotide-binding universal stress UspA family protein